MDWWNWILQNLHVDSWGATPLSMAAPFALLTVAVMARRFAREKGPKMESGSAGGMVLLLVIVGAAFLFIFEGLETIARSFR